MGHALQPRLGSRILPTVSLVCVEMAFIEEDWREVSGWLSYRWLFKHPFPVDWGSLETGFIRENKKVSKSVWSVSTLPTRFQNALVHKFQVRRTVAWASAQWSVNRQVAAAALLALRRRALQPCSVRSQSFCSLCLCPILPSSLFPVTSSGYPLPRRWLACHPAGLPKPFVYI